MSKGAEHEASDGVNPAVLPMAGFSRRSGRTVRDLVLSPTVASVAAGTGVGQERSATNVHQSVAAPNAAAAAPPSGRDLKSSS